MKLDLNKYRRFSIPVIKYYLKMNPRRKIQESISNISILTGAPVLAIVYFVEELLGPKEELTTLANNLKVFYKITEVTGVVEVNF